MVNPRTFVNNIDWLHLPAWLLGRELYKAARGRPRGSSRAKVRLVPDSGHSGERPG